jgi:hypothetical protein
MLAGVLTALGCGCWSASVLLAVSCLFQAALTTLEVALELWLALVYSPQARMIRHSTTAASGLLQVGLVLSTS